MLNNVCNSLNVPFLSWLLVKELSPLLLTHGSDLKTEHFSTVEQLQ